MSGNGNEGVANKSGPVQLNSDRMIVPRNEWLHSVVKGYFHQNLTSTKFYNAVASGLQNCTDASSIISPSTLK